MKTKTGGTVVTYTVPEWLLTSNTPLLTPHLLEYHWLLGQLASGREPAQTQRMLAEEDLVFDKHTYYISIEA